MNLDYPYHFDHRGRSAIRNWAQRTYDQYDVRLSPELAITEGEATVVRTRVAGSFIGSPIELKFRFVTDGDRIEDVTDGTTVGTGNFTVTGTPPTLPSSSGAVLARSSN